MQVALMELIENHQPHPFQFRVLLQTPGENTLSDHLDAGLPGELAIKAHPVPHRLTNPLIQQLCHARSRGANRQAAGFQHEDGLPLEPGLL